MRFPAIVTLIYSIIVFSGGLVGYIIAGSLPSLIAGTLFGVLILSSSLRMFKNFPKAQTLAFLQSIVLGAFFGYRYVNGYAFFPAGFMVIISAIVALILLLTLPKRVPTKG